MEAYDFVITVLARNRRYSRLIENNGTINHECLYEDIIKCPPEFLKKVGIRIHHMHRYSPALDEAFYNLSKNVLRRWDPGAYYTWVFSDTPEKYFEEKIKPDLSEEEISEIEDIVNSID